MRTSVQKSGAWSVVVAAAVSVALLVLPVSSFAAVARSRLLAALLAAAAAVLLTAPGASAASWSVQRAAVPQVPNGELSAVNCSSSTACTAVGSYTNSVGVDVTLAERFNGTAWAQQSTPSPSGATSSQLNGVRCVSSTACTAVGTYINASGAQAVFAEHWNGSSWTQQTVPVPGGAASSELDGVTCTSTTFCVAVGWASYNTGPTSVLVERFNGTSWTIQSAPNAPGGLRAVSCSSSTACTAVGGYMAERFNGTSWTLQSIPSVSGADGSDLTGVSCPSSTVCIAVGSLSIYGDNAPLAVRWNGTSWTVQQTPNVNQVYSFLESVSCPTTTACTAVGNGASEYVGAVTVAERFNGTSWSLQSTPNPRSSSELDGVSCATATVCIAVGRASNYVPDEYLTTTLAQAWNGSGWTTQTTPNPAGATSSQLNGVSCTSSTACTAVGYYNNYYNNSSGVQVTLAERWNGTSWSLQTTPNPAGATSSQLNEVSCTSSTACTAVGFYNNASGDGVTLAERWNGTSWSLQTTPNPAGTTYSFLSGVSCTSSTACTAVGFYNNASGVQVTLAERWNGTSWSLQTTPNPAGATSSQLNGMSCTSSTACVAVGSFEPAAGRFATLAERFDGTAWAIDATPSPPSGTDDRLSAVSCSTATACVAVGGRSSSAPPYSAPLIERSG